MTKEFYLDYASTSPVSDKVATQIQEYLTKVYGNPSSLHLMGESAYEEITKARISLAKAINAKPHEIIFTSGATEANNLALNHAKVNKKKLVVSSIEHPSVMEKSNQLKEEGLDVAKIKVDSTGYVDFNQLEKEVSEGNSLVSIMHVNNIIGTIQDVKRIGEICIKYGAIFHSDAAQSFGKLKIDVKKMNIDLLSASGHKLGGPKGTGFLYVRGGIDLEPVIYGGGQEKGLRSGTENVPGIAGFAKALESFGEFDSDKIRKTKRKFVESLGKLSGVILGPQDDRCAYWIINVSFPGIDNMMLVEKLSQEGIYVSAGSACESKKKNEKYVLKSLGLSKSVVDGSIRISLGEMINDKDIGYIFKIFDKSLKNLRR